MVEVGNLTRKGVATQAVVLDQAVGFGPKTAFFDAVTPEKGRLHVFRD